MAKESHAGHEEKETMSQKNPKSYRRGNTPKDKVKMKVTTLTGSKWGVNGRKW